MRACLVVLALAACKSDRPARSTPPPAPDAAADVAVRFAWPAAASARVYEQVTVPSGTVDELTFLLDVTSGAAPGAVTVTIGEVEGQILTSAQWLLMEAKHVGGLQFEVAADGSLAGTPLLEDIRARTTDLLAHAPPSVSAETVAKLRVGTALITTDPELPAAITNQLSDLWIPWVWLWAKADTLPAPGTTRTVAAFGLTFTLRTLDTSGTWRVEAVTDRQASSEKDLVGNRSWFLPTGQPVPDLEASYHLVVTAELEPQSLLPHTVTLDVREDSPHAPKPRTWRYAYRFDWV